MSTNVDHAPYSSAGLGGAAAVAKALNRGCDCRSLDPERLRQHLRRIARLLRLLAGLRQRRMLADVAPEIVDLFKELVRSECRKHRLSDYLGKNIELLSLRMTESAGKTGERYITTTRREYFGMLQSAAFGGLIIACI